MAKNRRQSGQNISAAPGLDPDIAAEAASAEAAVRFIDKQALSWKNVLSVQKEIEKTE